MQFDQAKTVLNWWCQLLVGEPASSNRVRKSYPLEDGRDLSWWTENDRTAPGWRNARTVAYLCAYLELGEGTIPLEGLKLDDGYMWPDRAVIKTLLTQGFLERRGDRFFPTERAEILVAPFLDLSAPSTKVVHHSRLNGTI